jgi:hypothetical protein
MLNTGSKMHEQEVELPKGKWKLIANANQIALELGFAEYHEILMGGKRKLLIEPHSISIWVKNP